ncbi:hypothetical protein TNCT_494661 [Trichonephila clavata]|uniref:Methyltransferase domain-containing protein n=1 Tax=Trichonephila clavata TaxID=2740835 RepID=A0A8X6J948_TRICU|nr:hypothetical protein TNCT_494661 [Trichonephila clavata]
MDTYPSLKAAVDFINKLKNEFNWQISSRDTLMDIGCGKTFYCSQAIVNLFPDFKCLIAIDKNADLLQWRPRENKRFENLHKSNIIKLLVADVEDSTFFENYIDSVDKIVSRNVLYHVKNKIKALRNIYKTLKPGGAAAILFWLDNPIGTWTTEILSMRKWSSFVDDSKPRPPYFPSKYRETYYRAEMEALGCQDIHAVTKSIPCSYESDKECLGELLEIVDDLINIPPTQIKEFEEDCLDIFKGLVGCINGGPITFNIMECFLHIVK